MVTGIQQPLFRIDHQKPELDVFSWILGRFCNLALFFYMISVVCEILGFVGSRGRIGGDIGDDLSFVCFACGETHMFFQLLDQGFLPF